MQLCLSFILILALLGAPRLGISLDSSPSSQPSLLLDGIPPADQSGVVQAIFSIEIPGYPGAYNPSVVSLKKGFLLSFRYDDENRHKALVGLVRLDRNWNVVGQPVISDLAGELEDVRLFAYQDRVFAIATRLMTRQPAQSVMTLSQVDLKRLMLKKEKDLSYHPQTVEKNWTPLVHTDSEGHEQLFFIYHHNPLQLLRLQSPSTGVVETVEIPFQKLPLVWERQWGKIRGGTPCVGMGDERLEFFHSAFDDGVRWWWVMGAMTFDASLPCTIHRISPVPIMATGMYTTPLMARCDNRTFRVAFPGGFVKVRKRGKSLLYLVYGENDSGIKVLVFDKARLLASLVDVRVG